MKKFERYLLSKQLFTEEAKKIHEVPLDKIDSKLQAIIDKLAGGNIEDDWKVFEDGSFYTMTNSYHVLDTDGTWMGWVDFDVVIPKDEFEKFELKFSNKESQELAHESDLSDFLESEIADTLKPAEEEPIESTPPEEETKE